MLLNCGLVFSEGSTRACRQIELTGVALSDTESEGFTLATQLDAFQADDAPV